MTEKSKLSKGSVVVVGAGVFGGWTALYLQRVRYKVTLVDAWGPGNSRASSGGETRVLRLGYGGDKNLFYLALRARQLWLEEQKNFKEPVYFETGCLWMLENEGKLLKDSLPHFQESRTPIEEISVAHFKKRYPQINSEGLGEIFLEHHAGYLLARRSCAAVVEQFVREGGSYICSQVLPLNEVNKETSSIILSNGEKLTADSFVFACGPWLSQILPSVLPNLIRPTRQEVFFFGPLASRNDLNELPPWINLGSDKFFYGIPGNEQRGFKVANDLRRESFDPTFGERKTNLQQLDEARVFMESRFPEMKGAPLLESRVCQYENSPDQKFIMGQIKNNPRFWIAGGGSGHGFKHGPAFGQMMANAISQQETIPSEFSLDRF